MSATHKRLGVLEGRAPGLQSPHEISVIRGESIFRSVTSLSRLSDCTRAREKPYALKIAEIPRET